ncbi:MULTISPECIES: LysR family transcriptional regulator [unclassified Streptomyces]|uniref:LysR family transcriptional regulator n=1 Tax=unclassified Streptomyces TaxID=2593676 RepID=UPI002E288042|nr:LysR family transcriptional regulator [Streptomyces sp. NBC_01429]
MNTKQLDAFLAVAELSSFTKAAHSLGVSQPTVTARIKSLELSFGISLLHRSAGGTRLTPAGRRLHRYASRIVRLSEFAQRAVCDAAERPPTFVVGAAECLTAYRLVPLIEHMHLRHPGVELSIHSLQDDPVTLVRDEAVDCAFYIGARAASPADIGHQLLYPEPLTLVAAPFHPLAAARTVSTRELTGHTVACVQRGSSYQSGFEQAFAGIGSGAPGILSLGSIEAVKRGVAEGIGIALLPEITVTDELRGGTLRRIDWQPPFEVFAQCVWRRDLSDSAIFRAVFDAALQLTAEQAEAHEARQLQTAC